MRWIEFELEPSGTRVAINPQNVCAVYDDRDPTDNVYWVIIEFVGGNQLKTQASYEAVLTKLSEGPQPE